MDHLTFLQWKHWPCSEPLGLIQSASSTNKSGHLYHLKIFLVSTELENSSKFLSEGKTFLLKAEKVNTSYKYKKSEKAPFLKNINKHSDFFQVSSNPGLIFPNFSTMIWPIREKHLAFM